MMSYNNTHQYLHQKLQLDVIVVIPTYLQAWEEAVSRKKATIVLKSRHCNTPNKQAKTGYSEVINKKQAHAQCLIQKYLRENLCINCSDME